jgi:uncharacterized protein (TIGR02231 family)
MWKRMVLLMTACSLSALLFWGARSGSALPPAEEPAAKVVPAAKAPTEAAPAPPALVKPASSRVTSVTVYPNSALVTREVDVPAGATEVTVTPLPPTTVQSSLYAEGTDVIRVLSTRFRTRPILEDTREDVRKLQDELKQLQQTQDKAEAETKGIQATQLYLGKLETFTTASTTHSAEKGALNSESAIALSKYIIETRAEQFRQLTTLQHQIQTTQEKIDFCKRKLAELTSSPSRTEQDAIIVVDKGNAVAGKVRLNYLVESAAWRPQYKLRASKDSKEPVRLEYLAAVSQHTGEDWTGVNLVLSTAAPMLNSAPPDLQVLNVTVTPRGNAPVTTVQHRGIMELEDQVKSIRGRAQKEFNEKKASSGAGLFNTAAALDQSWELLNPEAAVKRGCALAFKEGPSVTYHLATPLTVPSRNDEQTIEVTRFEVTPEYYYKAVPILTNHVYRLADLTNKSKHVLLPGEATMYVGTDFVGQQSLPLVAIGESFTAGFGVDPQLQIQRQMIDRSRTLSGGNQSLRYDYRILVSSYKSEKVRVQVWDRLPHADSESVGVNLMKTSPELSKDALYLREQRPTNLLRWDILVDSTMSGEKALAINYEFKLELDRQMTISSFESATGPKAEAPLPTQPVAKAPAMPAMTSGEEAKIKTAMARLSPEDRKLAEAQVWCAIDQDSKLGSMGPILKEMVKGRPVFVCCKGCASEVRANPDEAIRLLDKIMARKPQGRR